ncbi:MAG: regulatory protein GemA [Oscillospiraceae bacterium]|jgi:ClpP class serine protease|nr:regulatory protein GemA [Oscillospiraceae bacterium]
MAQSAPKMMDAKQRARIFAIANKLGLVDKSGNRDDALHALVESETGKSSLKELTSREAELVINRLFKLQGSNAPVKTAAPKKPKKPEKTAGASQAQVDKIWALMYTLTGYDKEPKAVSLGDRLCGIIKKELGINAVSKTPFAWLDSQAAYKLIECLKGYVANEKRKAGGKS